MSAPQLQTAADAKAFLVELACLDEGRAVAAALCEGGDAEGKIDLVVKELAPAAALAAGAGAARFFMLAAMPREGRTASGRVPGK